MKARLRAVAVRRRYRRRRSVAGRERVAHFWPRVFRVIALSGTAVYYRTNLFRIAHLLVRRSCATVHIVHGRAHGGIA